MADRDILERIDLHMERGNQLVQEVRDEMRLSREQYARLFGEMSELHGEMRDFVREVTLRVERIGIDELRELHELREESRAQREGFLRLTDRMDRFDPGGAAA